MNNTMLIWFAVPYIVFNVLDGYFTYKCLKYPGTSEANPVIRALMGKIGIAAALILIKAVLIGVILFAATILPTYMNITMSIALLLGLSLPFAYLTYRNFRIYQRKKRAATNV